MAVPVPIAAVITRDAPELGVVGVFRPVLVLPEGLLAQLDPAQLDSILAHEMCHVRRRDNLFAAVHMIVEAIFWFHPLVWWIGDRLMEERERACDEAVLRAGYERADYIKGILAVCRLYTEHPSAHVSAVTGANLKVRLRGILSASAACDLSLAKKLVLVAATGALISGPLVIGMLTAPTLYAQTILSVPPGQTRPSFEVASVRPTSDHNGVRLDSSNYADDASLESFIVMAYGLSSCATKAGLGLDCPYISGTLPAWARTAFSPAGGGWFEIRAKLPDSPRISASYAPMQVREGRVVALSLMLQTLLEERFHLQVHRETRQLPVYALTLDRNGSKLTPARKPDLIDALDGTQIERHGQSAFEPVLAADGGRNGKRRITFRGSSMQQVAESLTAYMDGPVQDRTGLKGDYDFAFVFDVDPEATDRSGGMAGALFSGLTCPRLSASLEELGLKCEATRGPVDVLVIDHVGKPSEN